MQEITALTGVILFLSALAVGQSLWRAVFFIAAGIVGASGVISFWRANFSSKFIKPGQQLYQKNDTAHGMNQADFLDIQSSEDMGKKTVPEKPAMQSIMPDETKNSMAEQSSPGRKRSNGI